MSVEWAEHSQSGTDQEEYCTPTEYGSKFPPQLPEWSYYQPTTYEDKFLPQLPEWPYPSWGEQCIEYQEESCQPPTYGAKFPPWSERPPRGYQEAQDEQELESCPDPCACCDDYSVEQKPARICKCAQKHPERFLKK